MIKYIVEKQDKIRQKFNSYSLYGVPVEIKDEINFDISKVLEKMPLKDMHLIINELTKPEYGLDSKINFICGDCEVQTVVEIPIGENFFS